MIKAKKRIMMLVRDVDAIGGAQLSALRLIAHLKRLGHEITLMGYGQETNIRKHLRQFGLEENIRIFSVSGMQGTRLDRMIRKYPNIFFWLPCFYYLWKFRNEYDVIHAPLLLESGTACALATIFLKKPSIVKLGSSGEYGDMSRLATNPLNIFYRFLFPFISKFVCLTTEIESELIKGLAVADTQIARIPNGIEQADYYPPTNSKKNGLKEKLGYRPSDKLVLFVGRLCEKKRVRFLLEAWKDACVQIQSSAYLIIIGDGPLKNALEGYRDKLRLQNNVSFFGSSRQVASALQASDVFVLPSVSEGLSNSLLEAMATALPVVTTKTKGNCEFLKHGKNAMLFNTSERNEFSEHLITLLNDETFCKRIGMAAFNTVLNQFTINSVVDRYSKLYQSLPIVREG